jgi:hypothetical protein
MTDIELDGRWSQLMMFISSTKLAESLNDGAGARLRSAIQRWPGRNTPEILPGLFLNWVIAGAALAIRQLPGMAIFSPVILSMMFEIVFYNAAGMAAWAKQGVIVCLRWLLRIAIFIAGFGLTLINDGVTRHDSGAASHLHRGGRKAARYAGRAPIEFDAISNQRRHRGAGDALRNQAV